jgi:DNA modification methylase
VDPAGLKIPAVRLKIGYARNIDTLELTFGSQDFQKAVRFRACVNIPIEMHHVIEIASARPFRECSEFFGERLDVVVSQNFDAIFWRIAVRVENLNGDRRQGDVWFFDKPNKNDLHPTMKPTALVERAIRNSSKSRDIVLDPFGGSGTTMVAAERTGRRARLVELDPKYVDVAVQRWHSFTGGVATLEGTGETLPM